MATPELSKLRNLDEQSLEIDELQTLLRYFAGKVEDSERLQLVQEHELESRNKEIETLQSEIAELKRFNQKLYRELEEDVSNTTFVKLGCGY